VGQGSPRGRSRPPCRDSRKTRIRRSQAALTARRAIVRSASSRAAAKPRRFQVQLSHSRASRPTEEHCPTGAVLIHLQPARSDGAMEFFPSYVGYFMNPPTLGFQHSACGAILNGDESLSLSLSLSLFLVERRKNERTPRRRCRRHRRDQSPIDEKRASSWRAIDRRAGGGFPKARFPGLLISRRRGK